MMVTGGCNGLTGSKTTTECTSASSSLQAGLSTLFMESGKEIPLEDHTLFKQNVMNTEISDTGRNVERKKLHEAATKSLIHPTV